MKHVSHFCKEALECMFEERAAIMEFDGGLPRDEAERRAAIERDEWMARATGGEE